MFERLTDEMGNLADLIDAHKGIHFRQQFRQFVAKTLRQTTGDDQALAAIRCLAQRG